MNEYLLEVIREERKRVIHDVNQNAWKYHQDSHVRFRDKIRAIKQRIKGII
ncbi:hypothetical protein [Jeotgalibacillus marinus]|uniref:Uncharacterized protein n=1 Tax=Jeotgalibacillus marinus TaxID=86667 RepID=A0ABV3Q496_9BACL